MKVKAYLHWEHEGHFNDAGEFVTGPHFTFWKMKLENEPNRVFVSEHDFEVEIPANFDPVPKVIAGLKKEKQRILAEAHVKAENLEDQIQRLLCIEHKPEASA